MFNLSNYHLISDDQFLAFKSLEINEAIVHSLQFVITHFFFQASSALVLTTSSRYEYRRDIFRPIVEPLLRDMQQIALQLVVVRNGQPEFVEGRRHHNLYLVDSLQAFLDLDPARYSANYNTNEYHYIFVQVRDAHQPQTIAGILDYCWRHYLINCNVQVQNGQGQVLVYTYFPFTAQHCGCVEVQLVNEFVGGRMRHAAIFPKKLLDMHGCPLRVTTWSHPPFMRLAETAAGYVGVSGFEGQLLQTMAAQLNFSIRLVDAVEANTTEDGQPVTISSMINGTIRKLQERTSDLNLGYVREITDRNEVLSSLYSHYQVVQVFCVLRSAETYSSLEILGFPFQSNTWYLLILLLFCGVVGVRLYHCVDHQAHNATKQQFDLVAVALGLSITREPSVHHKRAIFLNWMLGTFILRCIYLALLYDLFCTHLYRKPPSTMAGLMRYNYSVVVNRDVYWGLSGIPQFEEGGLPLQIIESPKEESAFEYLEQFAASGRHLAAIGARDILLDYGRKNHKAGQFFILPEVVMHQQLTIYVSKHSFLIDQLNELLLRIQVMGLMEGWLRAELDMRYFHSNHLQSQKFFGQEELSGIYYICGALLLLAFMVFLLELLGGMKRR